MALLRRTACSYSYNAGCVQRRRRQGVYMYVPTYLATYLPTCSRLVRNPSYSSTIKLIRHTSETYWAHV